jgi:hypothetical protein
MLFGSCFAIVMQQLTYSFTEKNLYWIKKQKGLFHHRKKETPETRKTNSLHFFTSVSA